MSTVRSEKEAVVAEVRAKIEASSAVLVTEYRGLSVTSLAALRISLRQIGVEYRVYKNTLARFAAREANVEGLDALLVGPTALAFVEGDVAAGFGVGQHTRAAQHVERQQIHCEPGGDGRKARRQVNRFGPKPQRQSCNAQRLARENRPAQS